MRKTKAKWNQCIPKAYVGGYSTNVAVKKSISLILKALNFDNKPIINKKV